MLTPSPSFSLACGSHSLRQLDPRLQAANRPGDQSQTPDCCRRHVVPVPPNPCQSQGTKGQWHSGHSTTDSGVYAPKHFGTPAGPPFSRLHIIKSMSYAAASTEKPTCSAVSLASGVTGACELVSPSLPPLPLGNWSLVSWSLSLGWSGLQLRHLSPSSLQPDLTSVSSTKYRCSVSV